MGHDGGANLGLGRFHLDGPGEEVSNKPTLGVSMALYKKEGGRGVILEISKETLYHTKTLLSIPIWAAGRTSQDYSTRRTPLLFFYPRTW